jgi:hypothetical protein
MSIVRRIIRRITVAPDRTTQQRIVRRAMIVWRDRNPDRWPNIREIAQQAQLGHGQVLVALRAMERRNAVRVDNGRWVLLDATPE